jgi:hypothetical protein
MGGGFGGKESRSYVPKLEHLLLYILRFLI